VEPLKWQAIARQGGKAAHAIGRTHQWTKEEASGAGRKGGLGKRKPAMTVR
jgi:uncharacterized protein